MKTIIPESTSVTSVMYLWFFFAEVSSILMRLSQFRFILSRCILTLLSTMWSSTLQETLISLETTARGLRDISLMATASNRLV